MVFLLTIISKTNLIIELRKITAKLSFEPWQEHFNIFIKDKFLIEILNLKMLSLEKNFLLPSLILDSALASKKVKK